MRGITGTRYQVRASEACWILDWNMRSSCVNLAARTDAVKPRTPAVKQRRTPCACRLLIPEHVRVHMCGRVLGWVNTWTISHGSSSPPSDDLRRTAGGPLYARDGGCCCGDRKASAGRDVAPASTAGLLSVLLPVVCRPVSDAVLNTKGSPGHVSICQHVPA